jgi:hypothetical protein
MGEAKQRRRERSPSSKSDRLPDFIFGRDKAAEAAGGFVLAGMLVTDIAKGDDARAQRDGPLIADIIKSLLREARRDPHLAEVGFWRDPTNRPPHGLKPPFPDDMMIARMDHCLTIAVRVDPRDDGMMRIDEELFRAGLRSTAN